MSSGCIKSHCCSTSLPGARNGFRTSVNTQDSENSEDPEDSKTPNTPKICLVVKAVFDIEVHLHIVSGTYTALKRHN